MRKEHGNKVESIDYFIKREHWVKKESEWDGSEDRFLRGYFGADGVT